MPLTISPITSIKPLVRTVLAAGSLFVASQATSSCSSSESKPASNQKPKTEQTDTTKKAPTPIDLTKPNLPIISDYSSMNNSCRVQFKDSLGNTITRYVNYYSGTALYKGIRKYSTEESPDITNIWDFYAYVTNNLLYDSDIEKFNGFFYLATMPTLEKGDTITVNEYTKMMVNMKFD